MKPNLEVKIGSLKLKNPVMVASGTFGYGKEFSEFINLKNLGAIVTKTITLRPRLGNPPPRTCETPSGMLNSIGLENPGLDNFIGQKLPDLEKTGAPVIVSIASEKDLEEFTVLIKALNHINCVAAFELNISCPNVRHSAARRTSLVSQDPQATFDIIKSVRKLTKKTLITKLSPNVSDIVEIAVAAESAGSDAVSLINTLTGMSIDVETRRPKINMVVAGLSGPAIRPVAVRMVWEAYRKIKIPIIGMGGITDTQSALEFIIAGSSAVSIGTANFINPKVTQEIISGLEEYLTGKKVDDINKLIGSVQIV